MPLNPTSRPQSSSNSQSMLNDQISSSVFGVDTLLSKSDPVLDVLNMVEKLERLNQGMQQNVAAATSGAAIQVSRELSGQLNEFLASFTAESLKTNSLLEKLLKRNGSSVTADNFTWGVLLDPKNLMFTIAGLSIGSIVSFALCYMVFIPSLNKDIEWLRTDSGKTARSLMNKNSAYILSGECLRDSEQRKITLKRDGKLVKSCLIEMP